MKISIRSGGIHLILQQLGRMSNGTPVCRLHRGARTAALLLDCCGFFERLS